MATANLQSNDKKKRKRKGRGNSSGLGGECGRGHKGQKSRSGYSRRSGFEGGQTPLYRRLPKYNGFSNARFKKKFEIINISDLNNLDVAKEITLDILIQASIISGKLPVKLLSKGDVKGSIKIHVHQASIPASKKIEESNGEVILIKP